MVSQSSVGATSVRVQLTPRRNPWAQSRIHAAPTELAECLWLVVAINMALLTELGPIRTANACNVRVVASLCPAVHVFARNMDSHSAAEPRASVWTARGLPPLLSVVTRLTPAESFQTDRACGNTNAVKPYGRLERAYQSSLASFRHQTIHRANELVLS